MDNYAFRAYCDICKTGSDPYGTDELAASWRELHFEKEHPDNPMLKENCRIKRFNDE